MAESVTHLSEKNLNAPARPCNQKKPDQAVAARFGCVVVDESVDQEPDGRRRRAGPMSARL